MEQEQKKPDGQTARSVPSDLTDPFYAIPLCVGLGIVLGFLTGQAFETIGKGVLIGLLLGAVLGGLLFAAYRPKKAKDRPETGAEPEGAAAAE